MSGPDDVLARLRRCLDEDEATAKEAATSTAAHWVQGTQQPPNWDGSTVYQADDDLAWFKPFESEEAAAHIARWDPARVLRVVVAHRKILDEHPPVAALYEEADNVCATCIDNYQTPTWKPWPCPTIQALIEIYADRLSAPGGTS
jgi:hypothetical protein